ncbi:aspartate/glutamate racemase family protein [Denitrobaculum tricleocarpae]|uniref:Hydantoin racemase n=1 Tax=Denitrobaculum tricleocarpae TaxID=2591009 RepID=A0A545TKW9_9PROT|nr:aspartate/glutamate racemase family protein [Denitrobaculum tricleocarpae]TQV77880.1 aspartate/glutamate racemase family protein [Denitrobaculum tricleocarpae]
MQILIINPNSTATMTRSIAEAARAVASSGVKITAVNPAQGPASIQGPEDGEAALPGLFETFASETRSGDYDAVIIACFDDTGLAELKARSPLPVLGIGEAAFHAAMMLGARFSVVTTLAVSVPVIEENIAAYGFARRCAKVRASGVPVLQLDGPDGQAEGTIRAEARRALAQDGCDVIVLGCAGMADLAASLSGDLKLPVVDGVAAAVGFCENLVRMQRVKAIA